MIKFNKHKITNTETNESVRVHYSLDNRTDGRKCITIYSKDYFPSIQKVFPNEFTVNDTDTLTDLFDPGKLMIFEDHPQYAAGRAYVESIKR
jgi:hypothetical protein